MDIQKLTTFFMWCTIINLALMVFGIIGCTLASDLIYNIQGKMFGISRETINSSIYMFFGVYKIFWLVFNAVPYAALLIIRKE